MIPTIIKSKITEIQKAHKKEPDVISTNLQKMTFLILATAYVLNPIDLVPEIVFGVLGFIDDFLVILALTIFVLSSVKNKLF
jgi:uncharacterized membrane protein YkvA (DUF1232 family)